MDSTRGTGYLTVDISLEAADTMCDVQADGEWGMVGRGPEQKVGREGSNGKKMAAIAV